MKNNFSKKFLCLFSIGVLMIQSFNSKKLEDLKREEDLKRHEDIKRLEEIRKMEEIRKIEDLKRTEEIKKLVELKKEQEKRKNDIIEKQKRGGLCFVGSKRHVKTNNKCMGTFTYAIDRIYKNNNGKI